MRIILLEISFVLVLFSFAYPGTEKVLWLTAQKSGDVIEVLDQKIIKGSFKKDRRRAAQKKNGVTLRPKYATHYYQVLDVSGDLLYEAPFIDPIVAQVNAHDGNEARIIKVAQSHERVTFTVKIPIEGNPGSVHFYKVDQEAHQLPLKRQAQNKPTLNQSSTKTDVHLGSFLLGVN